VRRARRRAALLAALAPALLLGAGCDLFQTREPAAGGTGNSVWQPPTTPEIVVENLQLALENGVFGDYTRALTDDFTFVPDDADVAQLAIERPGEAVYGGWTKDVETQVAEAIRTGLTSLDLGLTLVSEETLPDGRLQKYGYALTLTRGASVTVYEGQAWLDIRQEPNGDWLIARWEDVITPQTVESWGLLKGRNRTL
jgi:hypothetical protein